MSDSEELDRIVRAILLTGEGSGTYETYVKAAKQALLQWRTKSLLALLPESKPIPDSVYDHVAFSRIAELESFNKGYNMALQEAKDKLNKEVS